MTRCLPSSSAAASSLGCSEIRRISSNIAILYHRPAGAYKGFAAWCGRCAWRAAAPLPVFAAPIGGSTARADRRAVKPRCSYARFAGPVPLPARRCKRRERVGKTGGSAAGLYRFYGCITTIYTHSRRIIPIETRLNRAKTPDYRSNSFSSAARRRQVQNSSIAFVNSGSVG